MKKLNILSLFDGTSITQLALQDNGYKFYNYYAAEIDKYAIAVAQHNFPKTIQLGCVTKVRAYALPKIDLLIGGFPCQSFSMAGKQLNFDDPRGKLFFECVRLLKEINPRYFLFENVKMKKEYQDQISTLLGVEPVEINSNLVSAQNRRRNFWTNIPDIKQPKDEGILLCDIIEDGFVDREKSLCITASYATGCNLETYLNPEFRGQRQLVFQKPHGFNKGGLKALDGKVPSLTSAAWQQNNFIVEISSHNSKDGLKCVAGINKNKKWKEDGKTLQRNFSQGERIYSIDGKSPTLSATGGGTAGSSALVTDYQKRHLDKMKNNTPCIIAERGRRLAPSGKREDKEGEVVRGFEFSSKEKSNALTTVQKDNYLCIEANNNTIRYRKLTVKECERLQTYPDNYTAAPGISNTQRYKMIGNGFTRKVITHILKNMKFEEKKIIGKQLKFNFDSVND